MISRSGMHGTGKLNASWDTGYVSVHLLFSACSECVWGRSNGTNGENLMWIVTSERNTRILLYMKTTVSAGMRTMSGEHRI